jgi:protein SCO1/2
VSERFKASGATDDRTAIAESWTFLTGDKLAIEKLAAAVGFHYNYVPRTREYAHPTAIIVLSANGMIASYLHGLSYEPADLNSRVVSAALGTPTESTAQFVFSCFHFVEPAGFTAIAFKAMRYGGFLFMLLLGGALIILHRRKKTSRGNHD